MVVCSDMSKLLMHGDNNDVRKASHLPECAHPLWQAHPKPPNPLAHMVRLLGVGLYGEFCP